MSVFSCVWTEYKKMQTRKTPYLDTFHEAPGVYAPPYSHRFKNLIYFKIFSKLYHFLTYHHGFFPLINLFLGMVHCLFIQGHFSKVIETVDFLTFVPNFLFRDCLRCLLLEFEIGLSLGLPCLMPSMFKVIILIIQIIKTTYFGNTILMAELERKFSLKQVVFFCS